MPLHRLELSTSWGPLNVNGGSRAGEGTLILLPQLRLALDPGRPHRGLPPMSTVFISHGHLDHVGALGYWASQRFLNAMGRGTVLAPAELRARIGELLTLHADLEGGRPYSVDIVPVSEKQCFELRRDLELGFFATDHWVPTLGLSLTWLRHRLRSEFVGLEGEEIRRLREAGEDVTVTERVPLLAYCADTGPDLFVRHPELLSSEVLLLECTFFRASDRERAAAFGHLHLDDILELVPRMSCRHLILLHASRRHRLREVERILAQRLRPVSTPKLHHLVSDWE